MNKGANHWASRRDFWVGQRKRGSRARGQRSWRKVFERFRKSMEKPRSFCPRQQPKRKRRKRQLRNRESKWRK